MFITLTLLWCSNKKVKSYYHLENYKHKYIIYDSINWINKSKYISTKTENLVFFYKLYTFDPENKTYLQIKCTQFGFIKLKIGT